MTTRRPPSTVGQSLYWSYANLAMAHAALAQNRDQYGPVHYMIRARLYKGLIEGTRDIGSLAQDEKLKMVLPQACCYCGTRDNLSVDHLLPSAKGGPNVGENMVWSCRHCNSSKGAKDALIWLTEQGKFPPLLLLRRYLKLAIQESRSRAILSVPLSEAITLSLPFSLKAIPHDYPPLGRLLLWAMPLP